MNRLMAVNAAGGDREIETLIADLTTLPHDFPEAAKISGVYPRPNGEILLTIMGRRRGVGLGGIYRLVQPDAAPGPGGTVRLETRFYVLGEGGRGYGLTYRWNDEGTDAFLLTNDEERDYEVFDDNGTVVDNRTWSFPSRTQCQTCHTNNAGFVLGVQTH